MKAKLFTDGGSRGNPGPAAYGFVIEAEDGHVLAAQGEAIGPATNNVAEYSGLVAGMAKAAELGVRELEVAVISKNAAALRFYERHGLLPFTVSYMGRVRDG